MNIKDLVKSKMRSSDYKLIYDGLDDNDSDSHVLIYASAKSDIAADYKVDQFRKKLDSLLRKLGYEIEEDEEYPTLRGNCHTYTTWTFQHGFRMDMPEEIMFSAATPPYTDEMLPVSSMINIAFFLWYDRD